MAKSCGRGRGQHSEKAGIGELPRPVPEHPRRKAVRGDDDPSVLGRRLDLSAANLGERHIPERAATIPALEAVSGEESLGSRVGIELLLGEPLDPGESVARLPAALRVEEVPGEDLRFPLSEAEVSKPRYRLVGAHAR
jgi:hypothetical protein